MTALVVDNIGLLVTNDPALGSGKLGILHDASVVITDGLVEAVEPAGAVGDHRFDAEGACVLPGFVDSHTHLVFDGDRAEEFTTRMAGEPYNAGGIRSTTEATRRASTGQLEVALRRRLGEAHRAGTTTIEIKSGYGLTIPDEVSALQLARTCTDETTFLGAHMVPPEYENRTDDYVHLVCTEMLSAVAGDARWVDAFCETGAFNEEQCRAVLEAGRSAGLGLRLHANQLGLGPGVRLAVELECASVDHCTYLSDNDIEALSGSETVATLLPATDFSTRQPYPNARRLLDAGATVALASNCNPGSSYTSSIPFCIALAVREMSMTIEEAVLAATLGGAQALQRDDVGRLSPGSVGHVAVLDAPSHHYLAYRPGMQLIRHTIGPLNGDFAQKVTS